MRAIIIACVLIPVAATAAPGQASAMAEATEDDKAAAKDLFADGSAALSEGDAERALELFEKAYSRWENPKILINIGAAAYALGRLAEAGDAYDEYLQATSGSDADEYRGEVEPLLESIDREVGHLAIKVSEPAARILVDGRLVGVSPLTDTIRVDPGARVVVVEKPEFQLVEESVTVEAGETKAMEIVVPRVMVTTDLSDLEEPALPEPEDTRPFTPGEGTAGRTQRRVGVGFLVGGGVALLTGALYSIAALDQEASSNYADADSSSTRANILYVVGGLAVATGAVVYLVAPNRPSDASLALTVAPAYAGAAVGLSGSF